MFEDKSWYKHLPPATEQVNESHLYEFFHTMKERQFIWERRFLKKMPAPWTKDAILRAYKFTNVYRELDNSSQYLIRNSYLVEKDIKQVIFSIFVHRIFNQASTFETFRSLVVPKNDNILYFTLHGYPRYKTFNVEQLLKVLQILENTLKFKTLNQEAYKINTYIWGGEPRWQAYTKYIIGEFHKNLDEYVRIITTENAQTVIDKLREVKGVGLFLAHEYYQDFCDLNTYFAPNTVKFDKNSWTNAGPGAQVGLRLIFPSIRESQLTESIGWLRDLSFEYHGNNFPYLHWNPKKKEYYTSNEWNITLHNTEMWLCEYQKYWKMAIGAGKQRQKFIAR